MRMAETKTGHIEVTRRFAHYMGIEKAQEMAQSLDNRLDAGAHMPQPQSPFESGSELDLEWRHGFEIMWRALAVPH
jgi:hypothetical protein